MVALWRIVIATTDLGNRSSAAVDNSLFQASNGRKAQDDESNTGLGITLVQNNGRQDPQT